MMPRPQKTLESLVEAQLHIVTGALPEEARTPERIEICQELLAKRVHYHLKCGFTPTETEPLVPGWARMCADLISTGKVLGLEF